MAERRPAPKINSYVPCHNTRTGLYIVEFYDCPHCIRLIASERFQALLRQVARHGMIVRLVIHPRQYVGTGITEFWNDEYDRCMANYVAALARLSGYGYMNIDTNGTYYTTGNTLSPLILIVPNEPRRPRLVPMEIMQYLLAYRQDSPEFRFAINFIATELFGAPPTREAALVEELERRKRRKK